MSQLSTLSAFEFVAEPVELRRADESRRNEPVELLTDDEIRTYWAHDGRSVRGGRVQSRA